MAHWIQLITAVLDAKNDEVLNVVDIRCAQGDFLFRFKESCNNSQKMYSVGVDPINYFTEKIFHPYSIYIQAAVTNSNDETVKYFKNRVLAPSSTMKINKCYIPKTTVNNSSDLITEEVEVENYKLESIVNQACLKDEIIHVLKVDTQGNDLEVIESLGGVVSRCLFIVYKTVYGKVENDQTLYKGQTTFKEERGKLERLGFRLINVARFKTTPEANVLYMNRSLLTTLWKD